MNVWPRKAIDLMLRSGILSVVVLTTALSSALAQDLRKSARASADWAISTKNPDALADSIGMLLDSGYSIEADDPFSVSGFLAELRAMDGGAVLADQIEADRSRGQLDGSKRKVVTLGAGETHVEPMTMVAREPALIEARLWRGFEDADIDIEVLGPEGAPIAQDVGPETGITGIGAFVEFRPETCLAITLEITNRSNTEARLAILAPLSLRDICEE